jgi:hypothetical protein
MTLPKSQQSRVRFYKHPPTQWKICGAADEAVLNKVHKNILYIYASSTGVILKTDKQRKPLFDPLELALPPNPSSANTAILAASKSSLCSVAGRGLACMSQQGVGGGAKINNRKKV